MNRPNTVTFIGGSMDLTRKVMEVNSRYVRVPKMTMPEPVYGPSPRMSEAEKRAYGDQPVQVRYETEEYEIRQVGERTFVAVFSQLSRGW